jgi:hypothetical protein
MSLVMSRAARRTLNEQRIAQDLLVTMRDEFSEDFEIVTRLAGEFAPTDAASRAQAERYEKFRHIPVGPQEFVESESRRITSADPVLRPA